MSAKGQMLQDPFLNILRIAKAMQCKPSDLLIDAGL